MVIRQIIRVCWHFINKVLGFDSNLYKEVLEDGQNMPSFLCLGNGPAWRFFNTLKFPLTKRQPGEQL